MKPFARIITHGGTTTSDLDVTDAQVLPIGGSCYDFCSPDNITAYGTATAFANISLTGPSPTDEVSVTATLNGLDKILAFDPNGIATANATAAASASYTALNGVTHGAENETLGLDVAVYLPSEHALIDVRVSDVLGLNLSATGFLGATETNASETNLSFETVGSVASRGGHGRCGFDLGSFVTKVVNTAGWDIGFAASAPGQSLSVSGRALLSVSASVEFLAGGLGSAVLGTDSLTLTSDKAIAFNASYAPGCDHRMVALIAA